MDYYFKSNPDVNQKLEIPPLLFPSSSSSKTTNRRRIPLQDRPRNGIDNPRTTTISEGTGYATKNKSLDIVDIPFPVPCAFHQNDNPSLPAKKKKSTRVASLLVEFPPIEDLVDNNNRNKNVDGSKRKGQDLNRNENDGDVMVDENIEPPSNKLGQVKENRDNSTKKRPQYIGNWKMESVIGKGASGTVRMATNIQTREKSAIKSIKRPDISKCITREERDKVYRQEFYIIREAYITASLRHPNINRLRSCILTKDYFHCEFDYLEGRDLVDHLHQYGRMSEREARFVFRQLLSAVEHAHRNHCVHRDLKFENIRYNKDTGIITLFDFGLSSFHFQNLACKENRSDFMELLLATNCGSPCYASPQIYDGVLYGGPDVDCWSLGVILYASVTGTLPFYGETFEELGDAVRSGRVVYPSYLSQDVVSLIKKILKTNPHRRATLNEIIADKWVNRGYHTLPIDYMEFQHIPQYPLVKNPIMQTSIYDDPYGPGPRVHPYWNICKKKKAVSKYSFIRLDQLAPPKSRSDQVEVMMNFLRTQHRWSGEVIDEDEFHIERKYGIAQKRVAPQSVLILSSNIGAGGHRRATNNSTTESTSSTIKSSCGASSTSNASTSHVLSDNIAPLKSSGGGGGINGFWQKMFTSLFSKKY